MSKIDIELVKMVAQRQPKWTEEEIIKFLAELDSEASVKEVDEKSPPQKKQYVCVISDADGVVKKLGRDLTGWVVQIPEDDAPQSALTKAETAAADYNQSPKGRRMPLKTYAEFFEFGSPRLNKAAGVSVKTKEPVLFMLAPRALPKGGRNG